MASEIDASIPADNVKVAKSDIRQNFQTAADEISQLQSKVTQAWLIARGVATL